MILDKLRTCISFSICIMDILLISLERINFHLIPQQPLLRDSAACENGRKIMFDTSPAVAVRISKSQEFDIRTGSPGSLSS
jgi:hypothetical protein